MYDFTYISGYVNTVKSVRIEQMGSKNILSDRKIF